MSKLGGILGWLHQRFSIRRRKNFMSDPGGEPLVLDAPAKTNLNLRVLGRRKDGFHEIETRMLPLSLADTLSFQPLEKGSGVQLEMKWEVGDAGVGPEEAETAHLNSEDNLVMRAVRKLEQRCHLGFDVRIEVTKRIPMGAGLGGGSTDAAATLMGLNRLYQLGLSTDDLLWTAGELGSDIPFFIRESVCDCRGRGETVVATGFHFELPILLIKPGFGVSTPWAYQRWAEAKPLPTVPYVPQYCPWGVMMNDLEQPVFEKYLFLARLKVWLLEQHEVHAAIMSGSGSTMLAVLSRNDLGRELEMRVKERFGKTIWTHVGHSLAS